MDIIKILIIGVFCSGCVVIKVSPPQASSPQVQKPHETHYVRPDYETRIDWNRIIGNQIIK